MEEYREDLQDKPMVPLVTVQAKEVRHPNINENTASEFVWQLPHVVVESALGTVFQQEA